MSVGTVFGYTQNFRLALINTNARAWRDEEHVNLKVIDAALFAATGLSGILGAWANNTAYVIGNRVTDTTTGAIYQAAVDHTSAATGTFLDDRTANPTYWTIVQSAPVFRGAWATATLYNSNDFVVDNGRYAVATTSHTSTVSLDVDIANWEILIDLNPILVDLTVDKATPAIILDDDGAAAGDDLAQFKIDTGVAILQGTINSGLRFESYGGVAVGGFQVRDGSGLQDIWHAGNDGAASGLDADLLDGQHGAYYADITARLGYTPVDVAGDTMTGTLTLSGPGVSGDDAVTFAQLAAVDAIADGAVVDAAVAQATADAALPKTGGTMTGDIVLAGDGSAALHPASFQQLEAAATFNNLMTLRYETASGVTAGASTSGAYETQPFNVVVKNDIAGTSLTANEIVDLPAGDYRCTGLIASSADDGLIIRAYNVTDAAEIDIIGGTTHTSASENAFIPFTFEFTLAATKTIRIERQCSTSRTNGFGHPHSLGTNVHAHLNLWKVA